MITPKAFYDLIRPELPGIFDALLDQTIVQVARDFCLRTRCWRDDFFSQGTKAGEASYELGAAWGDPVSVLRLEVNGRVLFDEIEPERAEYTKYRPPFRLSPDFVVLTLDGCEVPCQDSQDGLVTAGALQPAVNAALLPDLLLYRYSDEMRLGVLARLLLQGGKPWTDRELAVAYRNDYEALRSRATHLIARGNRLALAGRTRSWDDTDNLVARPAAAFDEDAMATKTAVLLKSTTPKTGDKLSRVGSMWNYVLSVKGSGPVTAQARVEVSLDGEIWMLWGTMSASGTDVAYDPLEPAEGVYSHHRAVLESITGTNAVATVNGGGA